MPTGKAARWNVPAWGQVFTYYETPQERAHADQRAQHALKWLGKRPTMTSFSGMIRHAKVNWACSQVLTQAWSPWLGNARTVAPASPLRLTWRSRGAGLDLLLLNAPDTVDRVVIADAPGWRRGSPASELDKPPIQQILAEHRAVDPKRPAVTQHAAVIVPCPAGASPAVAARLLANDTETGAVAVEVQFAGRTDYVVSTADQRQRRYGPVTVAGQFALVSVDGKGRPLHDYLLGGTRLECEALKISLPEPSTTLKVRSVSDRTFHLAGRLPPGLVRRGAYLQACGPVPKSGKAPPPRTGFEIESSTADSITVRDYPVVECEQVEVLHSRWLRLEP